MLRLDLTYPAQSLPPTTERPLGQARNVVVSGDNNGTPWEELLVNDVYGMFGAFLERGGITASNLPDEVGASDFVNALNQILGTTGNLAVVPFRLPGAFLTEDVFNPVVQEPAARSITYSGDGLKMFVAGVGEIVFAYALSTPFRQSTATPIPAENLDLSAQTSGAITGITFSPDGMRFYYIDGGLADLVRQYNLTGAWDLSTASDSGKSIAVGAQDNGPSAITFNNAGTRLFLSGGASAFLYQYDIVTPWELDTGAYSGNSLDLTPLSLFGPEEIVLRADEKKFWLPNATGTIQQFSLSDPLDISTATEDVGVLLNVTAELGGTPLSVAANTARTGLLVLTADNLLNGFYTSATVGSPY